MEKKPNSQRNRYKHPNVYTLRTSKNFLTRLYRVSLAVGMYKCDLIELAVGEYCQRYFPEIWLETFGGDSYET